MGDNYDFVVIVSIVNDHLTLICVQRSHSLNQFSLILIKQKQWKPTPYTFVSTACLLSMWQENDAFHYNKFVCISSIRLFQKIFKYQKLKKVTERKCNYSCRMLLPCLQNQNDYCESLQFPKMISNMPPSSLNSYYR